MSDIKISIIMPVYKVEEYVGKAIESILAQTFTEFEFLIVDDGTPDRSGEICDQYAKKDQRIQVIHKENGGAPSARNTAIGIAQGKYVYFLDSAAKKALKASGMDRIFFTNSGTEAIEGAIKAAKKYAYATVSVRHGSKQPFGCKMFSVA